MYDLLIKRKMKGKILLAILMYVSIHLSFAQDIPVGTWRSHVAYNSTIGVAVSSLNVYVASKSGIFIYSKEDYSLTKLTRLNGLSDAGISYIEFNDATQTLLIAYESGNLDILKENQIFNFNALVTTLNKSSKRINHMSMYGNLAYLSTDFGIVEFDLEQMVVKNTGFDLGVGGKEIRINATCILGDSIYAATSEGVMRGNINDNLMDYNFWLHFSNVAEFNNINIKTIASNANKILIGVDDVGLMIYENSLWSKTTMALPIAFNHISGSGEYFGISTANKAYTYFNNEVIELSSNKLNSPTVVLHDNDQIWVADSKNGLLKVIGNNSESIYPNGPYSNEIQKLKYVNNSVIAFPYAYNDTFMPLRNKSGFFSFQNGEWTNFNASGNSKTVSIPDVTDLIDASYNESKKELVIASYGQGILINNGSGFSVVDDTTPASPLENISAGNNVLIPAISANYKGLWVANYSAFNTLHLNSNDSWSSYSPYGNMPAQLIATSWDDIWIRNNPDFGGITLFNPEKGSVFLSDISGKGGLPSKRVNDIAIDWEAKIWVGTDKGLAYYSSPWLLMDENINDPIVPVYEYNQLFKGEKISAICVDGANRIWVATTKGAWLFENDGEYLVTHFNATNSPLFSNNIVDIAVNHITGEVFFATDQGLISYRGTATYPFPSDGIKIFPNPVNTDFSHLVSISGLPAEANVKITDVSGQLVFQTKSNGGTATWDVQNQSHTRAATGVYLVLVSTKDGKQTMAGKIAVIN